MTLDIQTIKIEKSPSIEGLKFRGFRGTEDFSHMAEIINAANLADQNDQFVTAENIENNYEHLQRSDTDRDMLFVEIDGIPVGYGRCMWDKEQDGIYLYSFFLHMKPEGRTDSIGESVIDHFMQRLLEVSKEHPEDAPKYFQSWSSDTQVWYKGILEMYGLDVVRYGLEMVRPCTQPVEVTTLPEGIEVREIKSEDYRKVWAAQTEAFRDHWGFVEPTEKDYQSWLNFPFFDPKIWKVAWDGDQVVGMVLNFIDPKENEALDRRRGYTENISVRRPWRRQGVARGLLTQSIQMFQHMGMEETALGVDTENPNGAKRLYESVGYVEQKRFMTYRKQLD
jgi:ribosomal protein S18 acetylase RimI-like enzyme